MCVALTTENFMFIQNYKARQAFVASLVRGNDPKILIKKLK